MTKHGIPMIRASALLASSKSPHKVCPAFFTIGELWVTYDVKFSKPSLPDGANATLPVAIYSKVVSLSDTTSTLPLIAGPTTLAVANLYSIAGVQTGVILSNMQPGQYLAACTSRRQTGGTGFSSPGSLDIGFTGGAAFYSTQVDNAGALHSEPFLVQNIGGPTSAASSYFDVTFIITATTDTVSIPMNLWTEAANGISVTVATLPVINSGLDSAPAAALLQTELQDLLRRVRELEVDENVSTSSAASVLVDIEDLPGPQPARVVRTHPRGYTRTSIAEVDEDFPDHELPKLTPTLSNSRKK